MTKKQSTSQRAQINDLPKKETGLTAKDMKKVKGGVVEYYLEIDGIKGTKKPPLTTK